MILVASILLLAAAPAVATPDPELRDGDLVFQTSRSAQSLAIQRATGSRYSHMGLVLTRQGKPFVLEAVATVRYTPLLDWIKRGQDGRFAVRRLRNAATLLTPAKLDLLRQAAQAFEGKPYDLTFEWSDQRIYCSELVWKIYQRALGVKIGALQALGDFALDDPVVKQKLKERYGARIPREEPAISPAAMLDAPELEIVGIGRLPAVSVSPDGRVLEIRRPSDREPVRIPVLDRCGDPVVGFGEPHIRHLAVTEHEVAATFGKHCQGTVTLATMALTCACD
jgi:hypothetical protein